MTSTIRATGTCLMNPSEPGETAHETRPKSGALQSMGAADLFMGLVLGGRWVLQPAFDLVLFKSRIPAQIKRLRR
jgi:hypothetical protein